MTQHQSLYFQGSSIQSTSVGELLGKDYSFTLLSSSWDSRCIAVCDAPGINLGETILLLPSERDDIGLRDHHDKKLLEFCKNRSTSLHVIEGHTNSPESVWDDIYRIATEIFRTPSVSNSALVDLSATCRYYSLGVVAMLLRLGLVQSVDILYSECQYLPTHDGAIEFTEGMWEKRVIPFLDGICNPAAPERWLVGCGFEGIKTRRFVLKDEPDQIQILLPDPGFTTDYGLHSENEAQPLIKEYRLESSDILRAAAGDAVAAWKTLDGVSTTPPKDMQTSYICGGTKPHSLALALHALVSRSPAVYYIRPDSYKIVQTKSTGQHWLYRINDLSSLPL